jgi:aldose 1-epimerase
VPGGYDHNWNLRYKNAELVDAAVVSEPISGRILHIQTTEPGVQIYISQGQDGTMRGLGGTYKQYCGFTLEAQHFPDSPHHPDYPNTILRPGETYKQTTIYQFSTLKKGEVSGT